MYLIYNLYRYTCTHTHTHTRVQIVMCVRAGMAVFFVLCLFVLVWVWVSSFVCHYFVRFFHLSVCMHAHKNHTNTSICIRASCMPFIRGCSHTFVQDTQTNKPSKQAKKDTRNAQAYAFRVTASSAMLALPGPGALRESSCAHPQQWPWLRGARALRGGCHARRGRGLEERTPTMRPSRSTSELGVL